MSVAIEKSPVIQCLWIGTKLGRMERLSIFSLLRNSHAVHLYAYSEIEDVPEGVVVKNANTIIPESKIFRYKDSKSYAGFANLFRYKLLLEKGGLWADLDTVCLKPLLVDDEYIFASERTKFINFPIQVNNCLIKAPANCGIMEFCYNTALSKDPNELKWGVTGPALLTEAVIEFDLQEFIAEPYVFSPVDWWNVRDFVSKPLSAIVTEDTYSIHLYNESWKRQGIDKENIWDKSCSYEELFELYSEPNCK
jgi:mannosyltransferase OCH1-like enzyme